MTATSDLILERRRVRRRLAFWRVLAIIAVVVAVVIATVDRVGVATGAHVARVEIEGIITSDRERDQLLRALAEDDDVRAVLVAINSPGGTVAGSEALYVALRDVAGQKPVVAVMAEAAASGGYITAIAADHVVARSNSLTGSIGVIAEVPNVAELLDRIGIDFVRVKSAPLKAEPAVTAAPAPGAIEAQERLIADSFAWFRDLVGERRGLQGEALENVADGRVFTGRQALELGLVDTLGGEERARDWLAETHDIPRAIDTRNRRWGERELPFPLSALSGVIDLPRVNLQPGPRLYAIMH